MRHNDANKMTNHSLAYASFPEFQQNRYFLNPVLNIFILDNLIVGWVEGDTKTRLVFCIKSIDSGEVLIVEEAAFIKVRVGII